MNKLTDIKRTYLYRKRLKLIPRQKSLNNTPVFVVLTPRLPPPTPPTPTPLDAAANSARQQNPSMSFNIFCWTNTQ